MKLKDDEKHKEKCAVENIIKAFNKFPYFNELPDNILCNLHENSVIKCFQREDILLGFGEGCFDYVYFVLQGECTVLQTLMDNNRKCTNVVQLCIFLPGATFNVGEDSAGRCIVARTLTVWCLLVPRVSLLLHGNADNVWTRLRLLLQERLPSISQLQRLLDKQQAWNMYCRTLTQHLSVQNK